MKMKALRDYTMSDAELSVFASNSLVFINRDSVEFALKNVTALDITAYEDLGNAYEILPTDAYYLAAVMGATDDKLAYRASCEIKIREIVGCAKLGFGDDSWKLVRFDAKHITRDSEKAFLTTCRMVVVAATEFLTDLSAYALTQIMIDALVADAQSYEDALNEFAGAVGLRDSKTQERIEKGNELYGFVVKYCETGKVIWQDIDEAKYNDYVIYKSESSSLSKPQNLTAVLDAVDPLKVNIDFDSVPDATEYKLYESLVTVGDPSGTFTYISTSATNHFDAPLTTGKRNYWKVKAFSDTESSSVYSDEVWLDA